MSWTDERVAIAVEMYRAGSSASEIAKALGQGLSRNAIIGKLHRMGETGAGAGRGVSSRQAQSHLNNPNRTPKPKAPAPLRVVAPAQQGGGIMPAPKPLMEIKTTGATRASLNLRIIDPGFAGCKWPTSGEGAETRFCCVPTGGPVYCAHHAARAFNGIPTKGPKSAAELVRSVRRFA